MVGFSLPRPCRPAWAFAKSWRRCSRVCRWYEAAPGMLDDLLRTCPYLSRCQAFAFPNGRLETGMTFARRVTVDQHAATSSARTALTTRRLSDRNQGVGERARRPL